MLSPTDESHPPALGGRGESKPIRMRDARVEDAETIALFNEAMALETEAIRLDPAVVRAGVRAVLDDPAKGRYFVAERGSEIAGALLITYEWSDWRNANFIWLQSVYVAPLHRRAGVFTALYRHVERLGQGAGFCSVRLYMDAGNATARVTYERLGLRHGNYIVFETPDRLREP